MAISRVIDRLGDLLFGTPGSGHAPRFIGGRWTSVAVNEFDVRDYGALLDGTTDDTAAVLAALTAAKAAGGGEIVIAGPCLCNTTITEVNGGKCIIPIGGSKISIVGRGRGAKLFTTLSSSAVLISIDGAAIPAGIVNWPSYNASSRTALTKYTINPATKRDSVVTTATAGDAANFAVGDWVYIRTGQRLNNTNGTEPDAEINRVVSVNAGTGVIGLRWPLSKPYAQEYEVSGADHTSTTTVTATPTPLSITNITGMVVEECVIRDLELSSANSSPLITVRQVVGLTIRNVKATSVGPIVSAGSYRRGRFKDNELIITGTTNGDYWLSTATGTVDVEMSGNDLTSTQAPCKTIHIHEGSAQIRIHRNLITNQAGDTNDNNAISIRAHAYDIDVTNNTILNCGSQAAIYVQGVCDGGGVIRDNLITVDSAGKAVVSCNAPNWIIGPNDVRSGRQMIFTPTSISPVMRFAGWLSSATTAITLGDLPQMSLIHAIYLYVETAFDSSGTDLISIGRSGSNAAFGTATDVSTTGVKSDTFGGEAPYNDSNVKTMTATYAAGGTAATVGKALVVVEYSSVQPKP